MPRWSKDPRDKLREGRGTLRKHVVSRVWHFQYKNSDCRWRSVSTGHTDKDGAIEWARAFSLNLTRMELGVVNPDEKVTNEPIRRAVDEYLEYIEDQRKPNTLRTYRSSMNNLLRFLETRPNLRRLDQFDQNEVLRYRDWLRRDRGDDDVKRQNTKATADNNLVVLRAVFNYCVELKKMRANPVRESKHGVQVFFDERRPGIETYTRSEYAAIVQHAPPDVKLKVRFLANSGLRIDELAHLEPRDMDLRRGWLHVRAKVAHDGAKWSPKDDEDRRLPLNDELRSVAASLLPSGTADDQRYLFPSRPGRWRAKNFARTTLNQFKRLAKPTGIPTKKLTSHNFRRYFVSQCADCGIDILCVMEWVGHSDWEMVRRYYRLRDEHAQASMRKFTTGTPGDAKRPRMTTNRDSGEQMGNDDRGAERRHGRRRPQTRVRKKVANSAAKRVVE
jgi:integrase